MSMLKKDLSEQIVDNILRIIYDMEEEFGMSLIGVVLGPLGNINHSLPDEERKKKVAEVMGIIVRTQSRLTEEQKQKIFLRVSEKIFKFEIGKPPLF